MSRSGEIVSSGDSANSLFAAKCRPGLENEKEARERDGEGTREPARGEVRRFEGSTGVPGFQVGGMAPGGEDGAGEDSLGTREWFLSDSEQHLSGGAASPSEPRGDPPC